MTIPPGRICHSDVTAKSRFYAACHWGFDHDNQYWASIRQNSSLEYAHKCFLIDGFGQFRPFHQLRRTSLQLVQSTESCVHSLHNDFSCSPLLLGKIQTAAVPAVSYSSYRKFWGQRLNLRKSLTSSKNRFATKSVRIEESPGRNGGPKT